MNYTGDCGSAHGKRKCHSDGGDGDSDSDNGDDDGGDSNIQLLLEHRSESRQRRHG